MTKKISLASISEIKKLIKAKNVIIGTEKTIKNLKSGKIEKVFLASNCPDKTKEDINYYAKLSKAELIQLNYPNDELGVICKKPFYISVLGLLKGGN